MPVPALAEEETEFKGATAQFFYLKEKTSLTPMKKIENSINKIQEKKKKKNLRQQDKSEFTKKHIKEEEDGDGCQR